MPTCWQNLLLRESETGNPETKTVSNGSAWRIKHNGRKHGVAKRGAEHGDDRCPKADSHIMYQMYHENVSFSLEESKMLEDWNLFQTRT